ncbi:hypothetical protein PsYK624_007640 [Phanerochaete sordida]|uniref:Protein kinase domain-containing protein n=1 Tax=Phanerochaete sordida TaxID=48140 RepID=A0A9P3L873_9APHY|nr:hypothetical protein PsYK624_007640 [Phanerochaete sordida]
MDFPESTTSHRAIDLLLSYPEQSPFDLQPAVFNLIPQPDPLESFDTPAVKEAALAVARSSAVNIFMLMHGTNPLLLVDNDFAHARAKQTKMTAYHTPPRLPEVPLPETLEIIKELNPDGHTPIFLVCVDGNLRVMKTFPDRARYGKSDAGDPRDLFNAEAQAYAHLLHYGVCAKGVVPMCYGWARLSDAHIETIMDMPDASFRALDLQFHNGDLPRAIMLEFFPDADIMSIKNVTMSIAEKAFRALHDIHKAYVEHGDVHRRNILLLPDERVVWVDFDNSRTASSRKLTRSDLYEELMQGWEYMYMSMIPDKRIGFIQWLG